METTDKKNIQLKKTRWGLESILKAIAFLVTLGILLKGWIDVDETYDTWGYHLPFAARIWGIVPGEQFIHMEERFDGFPLLGEFFQGFLWLITQRVQSANLVGFFSLVLYGYFLKAYFKVPYYLTAIALLGVPLIQAHAVNCYVDLLGNIFLAMSIMMAYVLFKEQKLPTTTDLLVIFFSSFGASNSKPQLEPLVFLVLGFIVLRIVWLHWHFKQSKISTWLLKAIPIGMLASLLIFATPIKNIVTHGNPFYPVRIEIAGKVLNHALPLYSEAPGYLANAPKAQRWLYSILDVNSAYWNHDLYSADIDRNRMGGFFGAYVIFQVVLLIYAIVTNSNRDTYRAGILVLIMSLFAANFPQSHELRYFMYWMIVLISLNLYLVANYQSRLINPRYLGLISLIALIIVGIKTDYIYLQPSFNTLDKFKDKKIDRLAMAQIKPLENICLPNRYPYTFGYTAWFHPEQDYTYRIRSAFRGVCAKSDKVIGIVPYVEKEDNRSSNNK
ncbi:hypothetical protein I4641_13045 [Waterburya agarophytonicola K14]|uniref:Uncharacterized protein n=1 Tax=Waterburya agarophytonicola KI4 TaxID=2874699 RepID=A0A964BU51_9CYAN|nr:hypothetical protein [Waterburya agarophytonicola]MCC0177905.1 hypothetical protein [Waterburya agarophytonicola KI4]